MYAKDIVRTNFWKILIEFSSIEFIICKYVRQMAFVTIIEFKKLQFPETILSSTVIICCRQTLSVVETFQLKSDVVWPKSNLWRVDKCQVAFSKHIIYVVKTLCAFYRNDTWKWTFNLACRNETQNPTSFWKFQVRVISFKSN